MLPVTFPDRTKLTFDRAHRAGKQTVTFATLVVALGWIPTPGLLTHAEDAKTRRPNIVLIMADDMGYECVRANGGNYETPRLDALAREGMRFRHCHSQPICTPSRVQIMTGMYNNRNYIRFGYLDSQATTFGHVLKQAGYATCIVGKWQLKGGMNGPRHFGFDEYCLWQLTRRPSRYANPGLEINGREIDYRDGEYGPDIVSDFLCDFIQRNKDKPFFAYYPMILPHWPFEPTPDHPDYDKTASSKDKNRDPKYFPPMVTYVDKLVGKVADKLDALGIRENTLLIFTGDNGTYTGITSQLAGKAYAGGKGSTRDNGTHVPMIASRPGTVPAGEVSDALIDFSDILPTIAACGRADIPSHLGLQGISFAPLLRGQAFDGRTSIYCWYERGGRRGKESQHTRNRVHKLYADGRYFDVTQDFQEKRPIAIDTLSDGHRAEYLKLKAALDPQLVITEEATRQLKQRKDLTTATGKRKQTDGKRRKKTAQ